MKWSRSQTVGSPCHGEAMPTIARLSHALNVRIVVSDLGDLHGAYMHDHLTVMLDCKLGPIQYRSTAAHELGHAFYGHTESTPRNEREASLWAAKSLIRVCDYFDLARVCETPQEMAMSLGVLPRDVINYQQWMEARRTVAESR